MKTIFQQIIDGELPSEKILETELIVVIRDRFPVSSHHFLIIPKKLYSTLDHIPDQELTIFQEIFKIAKQLAKMFSLEGCYKLLLNVGEKGGQTIFHVHVHFIGGEGIDNSRVLHIK
ncbi:HIT domain-containing protein [Candidatus Similichlamydia epinepheli]|uniref:HIT domain-containing protein n=1 Tax=Candidatus Similichlamydia epinepheli TaxID=1903953 RepID=UPI000D3773EB|nr:HIT domain-containing protein [Candidatus Similichlamydia epinepheli]